MTKEEFLLVNLIEECAEIQHAASKAIRFGSNNEYFGVTNMQKLDEEFNDLLAIIELLKEAKGMKGLHDTERIDYHKRKVIRNMKLLIEEGRVSE